MVAYEKLCEIQIEGTKTMEVKFSELKIGQRILIRHSGKDVAWSIIMDMTVHQFSKNHKAIQFKIEANSVGNTRFEWKSIDDLNSRFEIFDEVY